MAGDWLKMELELSDKPEVHYIANALNLDPDAVVGKLFRVWCWFNKHTVDGNALGVTYALVDRVTSVTGFGEAMAFAGWLEQRDKMLHMPNFNYHTSESAKKRALNAKRQAGHREKSNANRNGESNAVSVTDALPREEKRRDKEAPPDGGPIWSEGLVVLTEQGLGEKTARAFLGMLCRQYDEAAIVEAVKSSVGKADAKSYILGVLKAKPRKGEGAVLKVAV